MTLSHDQASLRLVDFLYETLPDDEHAAVAAHLATCPTCAAEMIGWRQVRKAAGPALRGPLDEAPPPRLRAAILAAASAAEHEHRRAPAAAAKVPAAGATLPEKPLKSSSLKGGWWEHWRKAWVVPAFAMAAVFTLFVISRNTLFKTRLGEQVAQDQVKDWEGAASKASPANASAPAPAAPSPAPVVPAEPALRAAPVAAEELDVGSAADRGRAANEAKAERSPEPKDGVASVRRRPARTAAPVSAKPTGGGAAERERRATTAGSPPAAAAESAGPRDDVAASREAPALEGLAPSRPASEPAKPAKRSFAQPPPPRTTAAPKAKVSKGMADEDDGFASVGARGAARDFEAQPSAAEAPGFGGLGQGPGLAPRASAGRAASSAPAQAAPSPAPATSRAEASRAAAPAAAPPPPPATEQAAQKKAELEDRAEDAARAKNDAKAQAPSLDERVRQAERAFAARNWAAAARAFRELIRLHPSDARVPAWQNKALAAERASVSR